jgi:alkylated DNA repair dioxygenase AlkB
MIWIWSKSQKPLRKTLEKLLSLFENRSPGIPDESNLQLITQLGDNKWANKVFKELREQIEWEQYHIQIFGKRMPQPRLTAWYGETNAAYSYSGIQLIPKAFTPCLLKIKAIVEEASEQKFNSVLLNLYRNQNDSMGWHSDDEKELGENPVIASLSLGETRVFQVRHKTQKALKGKLELTHGSLLIMKGNMQSNWQHAIPKSRKECGPRINLTFRKIY